MHKCNLYPIFTEEELAKLMWFKVNDMKDDYIVKRVSKDGFMILPRSYVTKDTISINDIVSNQCVFYKDGKCMIDKYKPSFCNIENVDSLDDNIIRLSYYLDKTDEFKLSNLNKLRTIEEYTDPKIIKKYNKHLKEDLIHFYMLAFLDRIIGDPDDENDVISINHDVNVISKYYLYKIKNKKGYTIKPLRVKLLQSYNPVYKDMLEYANRIIKRFYYYPHGYIIFMQNKLNKLLKGVTFKDNNIDNDNIEDVLFVIALMSNLYKRNYVNKNKWKGFIDDDVIYNYIKYYVTKVTNEEYSFKLLTHPDIINIVNNVEMVYKSIMKNK